VNKRLVMTWVAVLVLSFAAWVTFTRRSPFEFVGVVAGIPCVLFIVDCVETATNRNVLTLRFVVVVSAVIAVLGLVHVPEIASAPIALILAWKFDDFLLRYRAVEAMKVIRKRWPERFRRP